MFCDQSSPRRFSLRGWALNCFATGALLASAVLLTPGCGHKKSPHPPPSKVPQKVELRAHQRGHEAIVSFPFPTTTISGTSLPGISKIEFWQYGVEVPEFAVELLAQEDLARQEAQALLDELGLPLIQAPLLTRPNADPNAAPNTRPIAGPNTRPNADPNTNPATDASGVVPPTDPFATPAGKPAIPTEPLRETEAELSEPPSAPPTPQASVDAESIDDSGLDEETVGEEGDDTEAAGAEGDDDSGLDEETVGGEGGDTEAAGVEGDTEGEERELTEEELLEQKVKAARTLLLSPPTPKSSFISATTQDFKKGSELVLSVEGDEVASSLIGDRIVLRLTLPPRPTEGPEIGYLFAAKVFALNGKPSDFSATQAILPTDTPPPPQDVVVDARTDGIQIQWSAAEAPAAGFRIYRRDAQTRLYGEPLTSLTLGTERSFLDQQAIFGARYIYGLTALATSSPLLESDLSSEHEVDYQDHFGPTMPGGLVAFPEAGRVRLLWTTVPETDVAGYEVSRRAGSDSVPTPITTELVTRGQYLDASVARGEVWFYSVVAVDASGNRSMASAETEVRVP